MHYLTTMFASCSEPVFVGVPSYVGWVSCMGDWVGSAFGVSSGFVVDGAGVVFVGRSCFG